MYTIPLLYLSKYSKHLLRLVPIKPFVANVKITENCNSRCITCNMWRYRHENEYSTQELEDIMKQMRDVGINTLIFTGGEPLLRDDISILIKKAKEIGFKEITVQTNGLLLSSKAEELVESGVTSICVSVDGIGETNDVIRGVKNAYSRSIKGIKAVTRIAEERNKRIRVTVVTTLNKKNIVEVPELLNICRELGVSWSINILDNNPYFFQGIDISELLVNDYQIIDRTIDYIKKVKKEEPGLISIDSNSLEYVRNYYKGKVKEPPCVLAYIYIHLGSKGEVYSGCWVLKPVGNLRKNKLKDILQSKEYKKRAKEMFMRKCPGCTCGYSTNVRVEKLPYTIIEKLHTIIKN